MSGDELRLLRARAGLRQIDAAERLERGITTVKNWEARGVPDREEAHVRRTFGDLTDGIPTSVLAQAIMRRAIFEEATGESARLGVPSDWVVAMGPPTGTLPTTPAEALDGAERDDR